MVLEEGIGIPWVLFVIGVDFDRLLAGEIGGALRYSLSARVSSFVIVSNW